MAFHPLVLDQTGTQIKEIQVGETLDLTGGPVLAEEFIFPDGSTFDNNINVDGGGAATVFAAADPTLINAGGA